MLQEERFNCILDQLCKGRAVKVSKLASDMGISESTIRRDINELDKLGKVKKVFGGAIPVDKGILTIDLDVEKKLSKNVEGKETIGSLGASLIEDDDVVFLDAGTTTQQLAKSITSLGATFVTNSPKIAEIIGQKSPKVYLTGGQLKVYAQALVGNTAIDFIKSFNFTKSFVGANGVDKKVGFTTPSLDEAIIKETVKNQSKQFFVLADRSKFNIVSAVTFGKLGEGTIITDKLEDSSYEGYTCVLEAE